MSTEVLMESQSRIIEHQLRVWIEDTDDSTFDHGCL